MHVFPQYWRCASLRAFTSDQDGFEVFNGVEPDYIETGGAHFTDLVELQLSGLRRPSLELNPKYAAVPSKPPIRSRPAASMLELTSEPSALSSEFCSVTLKVGFQLIDLIS